MKLKSILILLTTFAFTSAAIAMGGGAPKMPEKMYAEFQTNMGSFTCLLYPDGAPKTVANFVGLAKGGKMWTDPATGQKRNDPLYNGTIFHRVIPDFMIQGGDPLGRGTGGPGYNFEDEIDSSLTFAEPGVLAMANAGPNTNGSQFFVTVAPTPWLNGKHTIFGRVVEGYAVVEAISKVKTRSQNRPADNVILTKVVIK